MRKMPILSKSIYLIRAVKVGALNILILYALLLSSQLILSFASKEKNLRKAHDMPAHSKQIIHSKSRFRKTFLPDCFDAERNEYLRKTLVEYGVFPLGSFPNEETWLCDEGYGMVTHASNQAGFRQSESRNIGNQFLVIGDSFAHGMCAH